MMLKPAVINTPISGIRAYIKNKAVKQLATLANLVASTAWKPFFSIKLTTKLRAKLANCSKNTLAQNFDCL